jgi:demethylmenaquinone methyltransferase/2-methoxy-6-polyprenyl-1,4-benzoquinol methylase
VTGIPPEVVVPADVEGATKSERVRSMFGRIVSRYDLMNKVMTFGMDGAWRDEAISELAPAGKKILDVGTGTGDLALGVARAGANLVIGVDFVEPMLMSARKKVRSAGRANLVGLAVGDAMGLPFPDASFDGIINGFLLRNVADLDGALREFVRVLKPGGRLVCLEITHPPRLLAPLFQVYFGEVVPLLGAILSSQASAYRYLPASLAPLPDSPHLAARLRDAGLVNVSFRRLGLGTVALHQGSRPQAV